MKKLINSKTFWLAVLQGLLGIIVVVMTEYPEVGSLLAVKTVLDIGLRMITTEKVTY